MKCMWGRIGQGGQQVQVDRKNVDMKVRMGRVKGTHIHVWMGGAMACVGGMGKLRHTCVGG